MKEFLSLLQTVVDEGSWQDNRTGIRTLSVPGLSMRIDLRKGFPAITTRKLPFKTATGELCGFLRGYTNAADFRKLGCKVWDQNANENQAWLDNPYRLGADDLGEIYGKQWRSWPGVKLVERGCDAKVQRAIEEGFRALGVVEKNGRDFVVMEKSVDQVQECLWKLVHQPTDRRILFHAWNPAQLTEMALPPCHLLYHFVPNATKRELSLCLYVRSNDLGLGAPFNICEAAEMLTLFARLSGFEPRFLSYFIGDAHIYENHMEMVTEQLSRRPFEAPQLVLDPRIPTMTPETFDPRWIDWVEPTDFSLNNYRHHEPLTAAMAV